MEIRCQLVLAKDTGFKLPLCVPHTKELAWECVKLYSGMHAGGLASSEAAQVGWRVLTLAYCVDPLPQGWCQGRSVFVFRW